MAEREHSSITYFIIYIALLVLLGITMTFAFIHVGRHANNVIAMGIACIKAILIILVFMHLGMKSWITWIFASAGFLWLSILMVLSMTDYLTRNHPPGMSPKGEPVYLTQPQPDEPQILNVR